MTSDARRTYAPSPWRDDEWYLRLRLMFSTDDTDDTLACEIPDLESLETLAQTRLVVAAPDLYVACLAWSEYATHQADCEWVESGQACRTCYRLRSEARRQHNAAVAKAEGATTS